MTSKHILVRIAVPLVMIGVILEVLAQRFYWYYIFWWFDVIMHTLGGIGVGFGILWFLLALGKHTQKSGYNKKELFFFIVFGTLVVSVGWEIYEYIFRLSVDGNVFPDSIHDLFADFAGSLIAYTYAIAQKSITQHNADTL